ncbi:MAG: ComF family protein [Campylobacterales bacterium]|nr:ComF family protein [Campylobacterales bacterium]
MRCFSCHKPSISVLCTRCKETLLKPEITVRKIGSLDVYSFYSYASIEKLLFTKHTPIGHRVYKELANISFKPFMKHFVVNDPRDIFIIGIDERIKRGYSHVALLTHAMKTKHSKVLHASLLAQNKISYSGKTLEYRLENPRDFLYNGKNGIDAILIDDILTTGTTIGEARAVLQKNKVNVLFALTLADAR